MKSFKQFYIESPEFVNFQNTNLTRFNSDYVNKNYAIFIKNNYSPVEKITGLNNNIYDRYVIQKPNNVIEILLFDNEVCMYFDYTLISNYITVNLIWTSSKTKGLYRYLFFNFYLPKFNFIQSDKILTEYGYLMWKKLILEAFSIGNEVTLLDEVSNNEIEISSKNLNEIFENVIKNNSKNERFRIYRKSI